jgi:predicted MPP superfamily phosphohydrolase
MGGAVIRRTVRRGLWFASVFGLWLFLGNRLILQWPSSTLKLVTMASLAYVLYRLARLAEARLVGTRGVAIPSLVLAVFTAGEVRRAWLHHCYHADTTFSTPTPALKITRPFTTTDLVVNRKSLTLTNMTGRLRIVQLTDMHFTTSYPWEYYLSVAAHVREEKPDIILITGDLLSHSKYLPLLRRFFGLPLPSRFGTFAVLGNHDYWANATQPIRQALEQVGVHVLSGACTGLSGDEHPNVQLCGTEYPWGPDFENPSHAPNGVVIALSHTPDNIYSLHNRASVVFSGHYHAGQWRIPWVGPLVMPSIYGRRFDRGHFSVNGTELFVSAGLGSDFPPVRIYCPPELLVVDLVGPRTPTAGALGEPGMINRERP